MPSTSNEVTRRTSLSGSVTFSSPLSGVPSSFIVNCISPVSGEVFVTRIETIVVSVMPPLVTV
ncbi:hypothetical protein D3C75_1061280 [compost metagenome]